MPPPSGIRPPADPKDPKNFLRASLAPTYTKFDGANLWSQPILNLTQVSSVGSVGIHLVEGG